MVFEDRLPTWMRFQQKQDREKRLEQIAKPISNKESVVVDSGKLAATFGPGKVRQMFNERRQRGTGIDKSYPLQPITSQKASPNSTSTTTTTITAVRRAVGVKQTNDFTNNNNHIDLTTANILNGNVFLLNKQEGNDLDENNYSDLLDDEKFPDTSLNFDEELLSKSITTKLPNVGKLNLVNNNNINMVNNSNTRSNNINSSVKLKPVVLKKSSSGDPPRTLNGNRKLTVNRTAPPSIRPSQDNTPEKLGAANKSRNSSGSSNGLKTSSVSSKGASPSTGNSPVKQQKKPMTTASATKLAIKASNEPPLPGMSACSNCGRHFNEDRIEKHEQICQKTATKKRKVFDITKHRVQGTEAEAYIKKSVKATKVAPKKAETPTKKSDWRKKHEEFISAIRAAKEVQQHLARGGKLSDLPPPPPSENPDYVQCPHCNRRFNEAAATRHIPKCANMQHNKPKPALTKKKF